MFKVGDYVRNNHNFHGGEVTAVKDEKWFYIGNLCYPTAHWHLDKSVITSTAVSLYLEELKKRYPPFDPKTLIPASTYMFNRVKKVKVNGEEYSFYGFYNSLVVFCGILKIDVINQNDLSQYLTALETHKGDTHV